jgi:hypothetical protein
VQSNAEIISNFERYQDADAAVAALTGAGFPLRNLGIVADGFHTEFEPAVWRKGSDRTRLWSTRGALAGAAGAFILGALFTPASAWGAISVLAYLAAIIVWVIEGVAAGAGLGLAGALACNFLERKTGAIHYKRVTKVDSFQVIARGTAEQTDYGKKIVAAMCCNGGM